MTNREQEILELIRKNPAISQKDLAKALGITRSSVGVHITNLIKKGHILGKGYVLNQEEYVTIIGGSNMDIIGFPNNVLIDNDSNPGKVKLTLGGVGRNIGENLVKLGVKTKLISAVGDDIHGKKILEHALRIGLDMKDTYFSSSTPTSTYLAILDEIGDMKVAIAHMDIFEKISTEFIEEKKQLIENSKLCILDTNIPQDVLFYALDNFKNTDFFLDTVSTTKALKIKDRIGAFHSIKPNKIEAELLSGIKINKITDLKKVSEFFLEKGVKKVYITLGDKGVFYNDGTNSTLISNPVVNVVNATGAGDAFVAALAYCHCNNLSIDETVRFAMSASILALSSPETINPEMSEENVYKKMKEIGLC